MVGDLQGFGNRICYNLTWIFSIISLSKVKERIRVTYDIENGNVFIVHKENEYIYFHEYGRRLYSQNSTSNTDCILVTTVTHKKDTYT